MAKKQIKTKKANEESVPAVLQTPERGIHFSPKFVGILAEELVLLESILLELKHIADSKDLVKRERGRKGLVLLEKVKKVKDIKFSFLSSDKEKLMGLDNISEVDEKLIHIA